MPICALVKPVRVKSILQKVYSDGQLPQDYQWGCRRDMYGRVVSWFESYRSSAAKAGMNRGLAHRGTAAAPKIHTTQVLSYNLAEVVRGEFAPSALQRPVLSGSLEGHAA